VTEPVLPDTFHVKHEDETSTQAQDLGPIPTGLALAYPAAVEALMTYAHSLATDGVVRGLIGPREVPRLWERHIANCAVIEVEIPADATVIDIGSGAGLPGIVLALIRPDLHVALVDPLLRRTTYLTEIVGALGLEDRVRVLRGRAEEFHGKERAKVVTSRAVTGMDQLIRWSWPLVEPGGAMIAMKGKSAAVEVASASRTLTKLRIDPTQVRVMDCTSSAGEAFAVVIDRPNGAR